MSTFILHEPLLLPPRPNTYVYLTSHHYYSLFVYFFSPRSLAAVRQEFSDEQVADKQNLMAKQQGLDAEKNTVSKKSLKKAVARSLSFDSTDGDVVEAAGALKAIESGSINDGDFDSSSEDTALALGGSEDPFEEGTLRLEN